MKKNHPHPLPLPKTTQQQINVDKNFSKPINSLLEVLWCLASARGPPTQSHQSFSSSASQMFFSHLKELFQNHHLWKSFRQKVSLDSLPGEINFKRLQGFAFIFKLIVIQVQFQHWCNYNYIHYLPDQTAVLQCTLQLSRRNTLGTLFYFNCTLTLVIPCCVTWKKRSLIKEPLSRENEFQKTITSFTTRKDDEKIKIQTAVKDFSF